MNTPETVTVLLVEDNEVDVRGLKRAFRTHRIANPIVVAKDGVDALALLRSGREDGVGHPYLILLDLNLPRMNGIEFLQELRADEDLQTAIVIVMTTSARDRDRLDAYQLHVAGYIRKDNVGLDFANVVGLLDCYWRIVEFPPASVS